MKEILTAILMSTATMVSAQIIIPDQIHSGSTEPVEYATSSMEQTFTCGVHGYLNAVHLTLKYHSDPCFSSDTVGVALGIKDMLNNYVMGYSDTIYLPNTNTFNAYLFEFDLPDLFSAGSLYSFRVARISDVCPITNSADIKVYTDSLGSYDRGQFQHQVAGPVQGPYADVYFATSMRSIPGALVEDVCDQYVSPSGLYTWNQSGTYTDTILSILGYDSLIVVDLTINNATSGTDVQTACGSYTWIDGNTYTASNNNATFLLMNQAGCDSIVTLNLTINNSNTGTDVQTACGSYTWIDGNTYTANNSTATFMLANQSGCDSLVTLNLTINNSNTGTDVKTACGSYTWIDGNTYTANNSTATFMLANQSGCDSLVTLNLTINNVDVSVTDNGSFLTANAASANYQWIDCSNDQPVLNETGQSFAVTQSGNYAVIVTQGSCTDTSSCYAVTITGASENHTDVQFTVYPNPAKEAVTMYDLPMDAVLRICDVKGKVVYSSVIRNAQTTINTSDLVNGVYLIQVVTNSTFTTQRLVVNR